MIFSRKRRRTGLSMADSFIRLLTESFPTLNRQLELRLLFLRQYFLHYQFRSEQLRRVGIIRTRMSLDTTTRCSQTVTNGFLSILTIRIVIPLSDRVISEPLRIKSRSMCPYSAIRTVAKLCRSRQNRAIAIEDRL